MTVESHRAALRQAVKARLDEVTERVSAMLVANLEGYVDVPPGELRGDVREGLLRGFLTLAQHPDAEEAQDQWAEHVAKQRAAAGVPVESVVAAYAQGNRVLWDVLLEEARRLEVPDSLVLELTLERWTQNDLLQGAVVRAHREEDLARDRRSELRRRGLVRRLLLPSSDEHRAAGDDLAVALRLPKGQSLYCVRGRGLSLRDVGQACAALLIEELDGEPVALSARLPQPPSKGVLGYDGPAAPTELANAFKRADRAAGVAGRAGLSGLFCLADVALHAVVVEQPEFGQALAARYVRPFDAVPNGRDILDTVWQFLCCGGSADRAGAALYLHPNTVRNRVGRFEQTVKVDLGDGAAAVEAAWAIAHSRLNGAAG